MARVTYVLPIVLILLMTACGGGDGDGAAKSTSEPSPTVAPATATRAPTASPTPESAIEPSGSPLPTTVVPAGLMRLADPAGDVTDVNGAPITDALPFVDLTTVALRIDGASLILKVDTGGAIPSTLDADDEMWWALELAPAEPRSMTLYRLTVTFSGVTWKTINYDFEHDARQIAAQIDVDAGQLTVAIPLAELPKLDGPFRWWVAALWGGFNLDRPDASGDRVPDNDAAMFPDGSASALLTWDDLPPAAAPVGLGTIELPDDSAAVEELIARMPKTIAGLPRATELEHHTTDAHPAAYGPERGPQGETTFTLYLVALDSTSPLNDWSPGTTGRDVITFFASGIDWTVEGVGRDGQLGWVRWHREDLLPGTSATRWTYSMAWADADSHWYFTASATAPEQLDALVDAFVETSSVAAGREASDRRR